jgi:mannose/fructose/N-acetylgalactosamine-specific phosphotransferase system component IID
MMDIVQPVSNENFPTMNEAKSFTRMQRKSGFAMQLIPVLKDSFMINHYTQDTATVRIGDALIIGN